MELKILLMFVAGCSTSDVPSEMSTQKFQNEFLTREFHHINLSTISSLPWF